jgi:hypothetical protein
MQGEQLKTPYDMIHVTTAKPKRLDVPASKSGELKVSPRPEYERKDGGPTRLQGVALADLLREQCIRRPDGTAAYLDGWSDERVRETIDPTGRVSIDVVRSWRRDLIGKLPMGPAEGSKKAHRNTKLGRQYRLLVALVDFAVKEWGFVIPKGLELDDQGSQE